MDGAENNAAEAGNQLTGEDNSITTGTVETGTADGNNAGGDAGPVEEGMPPVAKKKAKSEKKKAAKAPKAPKAPKVAKVKTPKAPKPEGAEKTERKPRSKVVASGELMKVEASGTTYLTLEFETGKIVLTPTGNREQNRDIAVKALRALLKG